MDAGSFVRQVRGDAPKGVKVTTVVARSGPLGPRGQVVEARIQDEGLKTFDEESLERAVPLVVWVRGVAARAGGAGIMEWSPGATSDQRRLLHEACKAIGGITHIGAGPNVRRTLLMAGEGARREVEEAAGRIERDFEEKWRRRRRAASGPGASRNAAVSAAPGGDNAQRER